MKKLIIISIFISSFVVGQISSFIPEERVVDWTKAGLIEPVPPIENVINIGPNDSLGLIHAIDSLDGTVMTLIQLSSGTYSLSQSITLKSNTILKGVSTGTATELQFINNANSAIYIKPENLNTIIDSIDIINIFELSKGSTTVEVSNASGLSEGDYIHLIFDSDEHHFHNPTAAAISTYDLGLNFIGQMNQIKDINVNFIELEDELRFDFSGLDSGRVRFIGSETVKNIGIEDLKITGNDCSWLFWFDWAANCWVRGVESVLPQFSHIRCEHSSNMEITGNYIHEAESYGGSGAAYGVQLFNQTTNVLVENNIFEYLRHAMIVSHGANGNVFGYNYSFNQYSVDDNDVENFQGDISLHGHFPFANLFEGNLFEYARIDVWWGYAGPDNTFFRNRSKTRIDNDSTTNEGFQIQWLNILRDVNDVEVSMGYEFSQNIARGRCDYVVDVNNESASAFSIIHNTGLDFIHNNKDCNGSGGACSDYENVLSDLLGDSYYHESQPTFLTTWPFDPENYQTLPAYVRKPLNNKTINRYRYLDLANRAMNNNQNLGGTLGLSIDNTIENYNLVSSGNKVQIPNRNISVNAGTDNEILQSQKHLRWGNSVENYLMKINDYNIPENWQSIEAIYNYQSPVIITSDIPNNTQLQIHDPWFVEPQSSPDIGEQLDNFHKLTDDLNTYNIQTGQYGVFLNQNENFYEYLPIYSIRAPNLYATENAIYQFERWHGSNIKFNVAGATETNDRITDVVFLNGQASVTAEYIVVNDQPGVYQVPEGDELVIPPGANIDLAESFKIEVDGSIIMDGGNTFIRLNGNLDEPWAGIQVNETGNIKIDNVIVYYAETALTLNVFNLDGIIDHTISDFHVYNSTIGIDIITGNIFLTSDWEQGEYTPLNIVNCEFGGIINTAIRWKPDNAFYQFGKINVTGSHFMYVENGIEINGMDIYNDYYGSSEISYNLFSHCTFPINITTPSRGEYYWYPTLVVPEPQEWSDVYDPEYALKNIISYNQFYYYETALKVDGDVLLLTHHNLYDGESSQNSTAIDLKAYTEPPLHDPCNLHSHIIGNETIVNNNLGIKAMITNDGNRVNCYTMIVDNSIFYENGDNIDSPGSDIHADHQRNMILEDDPMFVGENNYLLSPGSPAIDGGIDMDYNLDGVADLDPDGSPLDMGAYYYQLPSTNLSFDPNMKVGDFPMFGWTPVNNAGDVYYDIYFHGQIVQPGDPFTYLTTTQTTSYMDIRYIVAEIEEGGNGGNDRQVKVRKNEQTPPEQEVIEIYYTVVVRDAESHLSPSSNEIMARVIRAPNHKEMDEELLPEKYDLSQGFPNPFNPAITLPYALPELSTVVIHVYDITGRRVATLKNQMEEAGYYRIRWNGKNMSNIPLPSGMYIIQMTAKSMEDGELFTKAQKVVLLK